MLIHLKFNLSLSDYLDAQALHARNNWWRRLNYFAARFVLPVIGVILILQALLMFRTRMPGMFVVIALGLGVFLVFYPWYYRGRLKRCYRRTRTDNGEISVELGESLIHVRTQTSNSELSWKAVQFFLEDQKLFMLYLAPAKFIALPKRVFSHEQIGELQSLLASQVKAAS
jgi:hypothetical protein